MQPNQGPNLPVRAAQRSIAQSPSNESNCGQAVLDKGLLVRSSLCPSLSTIIGCAIKPDVTGSLDDTPEIAGVAMIHLDLDRLWEHLVECSRR